MPTRAELRANRLEAVEIRSADDFRRAVLGKRSGDYLYVEIDGKYYRLHISSVVPKERICAAPRCKRTFSPLRSLDKYCRPECKDEAKYYNFLKAVESGRVTITEKDRKVLSILDGRELRAKEIGLLAGQSPEMATAWVSHSLKRLSALGMVERSKPHRGGIYRIVKGGEYGLRQAS